MITKLLRCDHFTSCKLLFVLYRRRGKSVVLCNIIQGGLGVCSPEKICFSKLRIYMHVMLGGATNWVTKVGGE